MQHPLPSKHPPAIKTQPHIHKKKSTRAFHIPPSPPPSTRPPRPQTENPRKLVSLPCPLSSSPPTPANMGLQKSAVACLAAWSLAQHQHHTVDAFGLGLRPTASHHGQTIASSGTATATRTAPAARGMTMYSAFKKKGGGGKKKAGGKVKTGGGGKTPSSGKGGGKGRGEGGPPKPAVDTSRKVRGGGVWRGRGYCSCTQFSVK